jgi:hypothetical protein
MRKCRLDHPLLLRAEPNHACADACRRSIIIETTPTMPTLPGFLLMLAGCGCAFGAAAAGASPALPDFSGIWRLNDQQSDSPDAIAARLRTERKREDTAAQLPASASSSSAPANSSAANNRGGRGGGHGMGGGGMGGGAGGGRGHGGNRNQNKADSNDGVSPIVDTPPPLLASDAILNVQQDGKRLQVALSDADQLNARLDGIAQQSLNGSAVVQTRTYTDGLSINMRFDGGTELEEFWVKSSDGRHLTVTEQWTTPTAKQPIVFKRSYDRLDI